MLLVSSSSASLGMAFAGMQRPMQHAEPPQLANSQRYKLLGEGARGITYLESRAGWPVAKHSVKYIPAEVVAEVRARLVFRACQRLVLNPVAQDANAVRRELHNLLALKHPNIVAFYGAEATPGNTHLALLTEAVLGPGDVPWCLSTCLSAQQGGIMPEALARQTFAQLAAGLSYAHNLGVVHRDLSLDNVMVAQSEDGRFIVKLVDFGSSKNVFSSLPSSGRRTDAAFAAPEVLISEHNASRGLPFERVNPLPADCWALGVLLLCSLMGVSQLRSAVQAANIVDIVALALAGNLVPFLRRTVLGLQGVSPDAQDALLSLLNENPASRLTAAQLQAHVWLAPEAYVPPLMALPCITQTRDHLVELVNAVSLAGGGEPLMV